MKNVLKPGLWPDWIWASIFYAVDYPFIIATYRILDRIHPRTSILLDLLVLLIVTLLSLPIAFAVGLAQEFAKSGGSPQ